MSQEREIQLLTGKLEAAVEQAGRGREWAEQNLEAGEHQKANIAWYEGLGVAYARVLRELRELKKEGSK